MRQLRLIFINHRTPTQYDGDVWYNAIRKFTKKQNSVMRRLVVDKVTRMLILYSELMRGEKINKTVFCFQNDCSYRTFERDVEDIRLFLSESFSIMELSYDKISNSYYIDGAKSSGLEPLEYLFVESVLKDTAILRNDEMERLLSHLLSNTENSRSLVSLIENFVYASPSHGKPLLKIHSDLLSIIAQKMYINIKYFCENGYELNQNVVPCTIKIDSGYMYLIAYRDIEIDKYPAYFRMDGIYSFEVIRKQTYAEQDKVRFFLKEYKNNHMQINEGKDIEVYLSCKNTFYPSVYSKFKNAEIQKQDDNVFVVKVAVFENSFLKWFISQPQDEVAILEPTSIKEKLVEMLQNIIRKYGGTD